jgi:transposase-like protein
MTDNITARSAALKLLQSGDATMAEIAPLANVTRQAVRKWAQQAQIDPLKTRRRRLQTLWTSATRLARK